MCRREFAYGIDGRITRLAPDQASGDPRETQIHGPGPSICSKCGAVWMLGSWKWRVALAQAQAATCPACRRAAEDDPAGAVTLSDPDTLGGRKWLLDLVRRHEAAEVRKNPLSRGIRISESDGGLEITTTDSRLPQIIGEAAQDAFGGELRYRFGGCMLRLGWTPCPPAGAPASEVRGSQPRPLRASEGLLRLVEAWPQHLTCRSHARPHMKTASASRVKAVPEEVVEVHRAMAV
jgi:hypothetical protein